MSNLKKSIIQIFPSSSWGGGEQYVYDLAYKLKKDGHTVVGISKKSSVIECKMRELSLPYYCLRLKGITDLFSAMRLAKIARRYHADVVHVHDFKSAFVAAYSRCFCRRCNFKIIVTRHLVKKSKNNKIYGWLYSKLDKIIFVSDLAEKEFLSTSPAVQGKQLCVIYNGVLGNNSRECVNLKEKYKLDDSSLLLGFTGRVAPEKGLDYLIEACGILQNKNFRLIIVGTGTNEYITHLKDLAIRYNVKDKVHFYGYTDAVDEVISQIDIGVIPSVAREAFGLSIVEFMQKGKPVITTNNGAQTEYIQDKVNGLLVNPCDARALSQAINYLMENKVDRLRIGETAKNVFERNFTYDEFYKRIARVYGIN